MSRKSINKATSALDKARSYIKRNEHAMALEQLEWFHHNALTIDPSLRGVRLSYALSDWMALGEKYPPALARLMAIRYQCIERLNDGVDAEAFQEFAALSRVLGLEAEVIALWKRMSATMPTLAIKSLPYVIKLLMHFGEEEHLVTYAGAIKEMIDSEKISLMSMVQNWMKKQSRF